jgi:hypothetical protein
MQAGIITRIPVTFPQIFENDVIIAAAVISATVVSPSTSYENTGDTRQSIFPTEKNKNPKYCLP